MELIWFKRDLRIEDHRPLRAAANEGPVYAVYVLESDYLQHPTTSPLHVSFLLASLRTLQSELRSLGGELHVARGDVVEVFEALHERHGITRLWSHQETGLGYTYERDQAVGAWARQREVPWREFRQHGVFRGLRERDGWAERWHQEMADPVEPPPASSVWQAPDDALTTVPELDSLTLHRFPEERSDHPPWETGETLLTTFLSERGQGYQKGMSAPEEAWLRCSRISPHLALGTLSFRRVFKEFLDRKKAIKEEPKSPDRTQWQRSMQSFGKRLRWHCHFIQKLEMEPELEFHAMHEHLRGLRPTPEDTTRIDAWSTGHTGYPMVDACMRSLNHNGWINFRMRAMLVSFACYHLWLPWQLVSERLARKFIDYEPGIHICQVQMQSGVTGINALRMYSPAKQLLDQDPTGSFVYRWVPELAGLPVEQLSSSLPLGDEIQAAANDYPAPIVEHVEATRSARSKIWSIRSRAEAKLESQRVYEKHGSRRRPDRAPRDGKKQS